MGRACRELGAAPPQPPRRRRPSSPPPAPSWSGSSTTTTSSWAPSRYAVGSDGTLDRIDETATGVFTDPTLLPVVFPGVVEQVESAPAPAAGDDRIIDIDFCDNASAIYHLEPIDDIMVREWGEDGKLAGATLLLGRFARGAFAQRADRIPLLKEKQDWLLERCGAIPNSHVWREIRATFNHFPKTELFYADAADLKRIIDRIVHMTSDDEIVVDCRKGAGYEALYVAFSRLRYSYQIEAALRRAFADAFGPVAFATSVDCGAGHPPPLLLRLEPARAPGGRRGGAPAHRAPGHRLGGPGGGRPREGVRRARGPAALQALRTPGDAERPLPRGDAAGAGAERPPAPRGARGPARGRASSADRGDGLRAALLGARPRPHRHPEDAAEPRPHRHRGAAHPAHPARGPALLPLPLRRRGARPTASPPCTRGSSASWRPCGPSTRSGPPTIR